MTACPEDLLYHRRLGTLPASDEALLETHLRTCESCAAEAGIAAAFETIDRPRPGDELLRARVVARAQRTRPRRTSRTSPWRMAVAAGLALVAAAGLARAGFGLYRRTMAPATAGSATSGATQASPTSTLSPPSVASVQVAPADSEVAPRPAKVSAPVAVPSAPSAPPLSLAERAHPSRLHATAPTVDLPRPSPDLKALFAAANEARRTGHGRQAAELYTELQRRFPDSREARLSFVSFGRMLLDAGETTQALRQFDRYLTMAPGDVLAAEAFYGRARALTASHRDTEAHQAWSDLLAHFPDSIYADVARRQLHKVSTSPN